MAYARHKKEAPAKALGMTPEQYRVKWDLPGDYPMVAPNYAAQRSASAKNRGFGLREKPAAIPASGESKVSVTPSESAATIEVVARGHRQE